MRRLITIGLSMAIAVAVIGFVVGIDEGVPQPDRFYESPTIDHEYAAATMPS